MTQVDCQHRLGHLSDLDVELPFMTFIGLRADEEMAIFNVINGKAKGLSPSLLDFHEAQLSQDLGGDRPELLVALFLRNETTSPWHKQLDIGGQVTSGMNRRASLRTLQKASRRFLVRTGLATTAGAEIAARTVMEFWTAVTVVLADEWRNPRRHLVTKGIGVYALMDLAAELWLERPGSRKADRRYFAERLDEFASDIDWSTTGDLAGLGGEGGVKAAAAIIANARRHCNLKVANG